MPDQKEPRPIEQYPLILEDLSNALNGALGHVGAMLRKQNYTPVQIEVLLDEAMDQGISQMRAAQKERVKQQIRVEVIQ